RDLLLARELAPADAHAILAAYGFQDPPRADALLQKLAGLPEERLALADLLPALLDALRDAGSPDRGLGNLDRYAGAAGGRLALFRALATDPGAIGRA